MEEDHAERYINKHSKIKAFRISVTARSTGYYWNSTRKTDIIKDSYERQIYYK